MRFKVMFSVTTIMVLFLLFYPQTGYLSKYENKITVDYRELNLTNNCIWEYKLSNDNIKLVNSNENIWTYKLVKNGKTTLNYYCKDKNDKSIYTITYNLKVKNNYIYWLTGNGTGLVDFPNLY